MMHPHTQLRFINEKIGHGVVATRNIPRGTITWAQDPLDREFTPEQIRSFGGLFTDSLDTYCFRNQHGRWVLCWDHARFVNHSFESNCVTTAFNFEIAIRDIRAGEELTDDYGYLNVTHPFEAIDEGADRTMVYPDDLLKYHPVWDRQLSEVWPRIPEVDQPLRPLLADGLWNRVVGIARGEEEMPSILTCYFRDDSATNEQAKSSNKRLISSSKRARPR